MAIITHKPKRKVIHKPKSDYNERYRKQAAYNKTAVYGQYTMHINGIDAMYPHDVQFEELNKEYSHTEEGWHDKYQNNINSKPHHYVINYYKYLRRISFTWCGTDYTYETTGIWR